MRFGFRRLRRKSRFCRSRRADARVGYIFILSTVLFHPLPYRDSVRIVAISQRNAARGFSQQLLSIPDYSDWQPDNPGFEVERVEGLPITPGFFAVQEAVEKHTGERL